MIEYHLEIAATGGNYSYDKVVPKYTRHIINKAEACLIEAKNSSLRDMLTRLNRRTKRQAVDMWRYKDIAESTMCENANLRTFLLHYSKNRTIKLAKSIVIAD